MQSPSDTIIVYRDSVIAKYDTVHIKSMDTIVAIKSKNEILYEIPPEYLDLIANTNSQLSNAILPVTIAIAALTALFTIGAVIAAVLLFRQEKSFKEQRTKLLKDQEVLFNQERNNLIKSWKKFLEDKDKEIKDRTEEVNELIDKYANDKDIDKLKEEIESKIEAAVSGSTSSDSSIPYNQVRCQGVACFNTYNERADIKLSKCPMCDHMNFL